MLMVNLYQGDCLEVLKTFPDNSVEAVVTDPPYGLAFMGKKWDYDVPSVAIWKEVLRILVPGGHLLSFGGTRTYHRMVVNIEDAGFEIRDQVQWIYGQGFPKSLDISKAIDKAAGAEREVVGSKLGQHGYSLAENKADRVRYGQFTDAASECAVTAPTTPEAKQWSGWGTALKPANEPIVLARKPLSESTVAANVLKWGTGGLNIDATRIGTEQIKINGGGVFPEGGGCTWKPVNTTHQGRFPANVIFDDVAGEVLDEQTQHLHGAGSKRPGGQAKQKNDGALFGVGNHEGNGMRFGDAGGASRFFYCAKASKSERNKGLETSTAQVTTDGREKPIDNPFLRGETERKNHHPTVKPVALMEYLIKLITPPNGIVLDPFMGSGTTGIACKNLGIEFVGIEREQEYFEIAQKRTA